MEFANGWERVEPQLDAIQPSLDFCLVHFLLLNEK